MQPAHWLFRLFYVQIKFIQSLGFPLQTKHLFIYTKQLCAAVSNFVAMPWLVRQQVTLKNSVTTDCPILLKVNNFINICLLRAVANVNTVVVTVTVE